MAARSLVCKYFYRLLEPRWDGWAAWVVLEGLGKPFDKMNISQVGDAVGPILNTSSSEHLRRQVTPCEHLVEMIQYSSELGRNFRARIASIG
jgi:hypothetical protein